MSTANYFIFDTETGGLEEDKVDILTLFGMTLDENLQPLKEIDLKIKPENGIYRVQAGALKVNRINLIEHDDVAQDTYKAGLELQRFLLDACGCDLEGPKKKLVPIGHNLAGDVRIVKRQLLSSTFWPWDKFFVYRTIDTAGIAKFLQICNKLPQNLFLSLENLSKHYDLDTTGNHDAKVDTMLTYKVLMKMIEENRLVISQ